MAHYLNEREVGFDSSTVGFPNIGACMGVVLQTQNGLYGFHAMPGDYLERVSPFATFIQFKESDYKAKALHLYGSCIRAKRYQHDKAKSYKQWLVEMTQIAQALGYKGPVSGFDMPAYPDLKDGRADTTYIEYRRDAGSRRSRIFYKRMSKMDAVKGDNPAENSIERITRRQGELVRETPKDKVTVSAAIIQTFWNKGEMHEASKIDTFAYDVRFC